MSAVLVLDIGRTEAKLSAAADGRLIETLSTPNPVCPGPPDPHHDLDRTERRLLDSMRALGERHAIAAVVACGHASGGVLVGEDDALLPMVDDEQAAPPGLDAAYRAAVGPFRERGSGVMLGLTHLARQILFLERGCDPSGRRSRPARAGPPARRLMIDGAAPVRPDLGRPFPLDQPGLADHTAAWRARADRETHG